VAAPQHFPFLFLLTTKKKKRGGHPKPAIGGKETENDVHAYP